MRSSASRNSAPSTKPPAAGSQAGPPASWAISMAGIKSDQTEAAIITPAAKPRNARCMPCGISFLKKKTVAAPSAVAKKVNIVPRNAR